MEFSVNSFIPDIFRGFCDLKYWYWYPKYSAFSNNYCLQKKKAIRLSVYAIADIDIKNRVYWGTFPRQISAGCSLNNNIIVYS